LTLTLAAQRHPSEIADETDECAALRAGIALGGALLPATGAAGHGIRFVDVGHGSCRDVVSLDLIDQCGARDTQLDGSTRPIASMVLQRALDVLPLEIFQT
jgi:hypothetical protein